jgi:hypothetical protein
MIIIMNNYHKMLFFPLVFTFKERSRRWRSEREEKRQERRGPFHSSLPFCKI